MKFIFSIVIVLALAVLSFDSSSGQRVRPNPLRVIGSRLPVVGSARFPAVGAGENLTFKALTCVSGI